MTNNNLNALKKFGLLLLTTFLLACCGTQKNIQKATGDIELQNLQEFMGNYDKAKTQFNQIKIKGKLDVDLPDKSFNAGIQLYIEDDERIWANVSVLGINIARANITQEGLQAYEVWEKTYIDGDFTFFNQKLKVDFINYQRLQNLLLGQLFLIDSVENYRIEFSDKKYILTHKDNEAISQRKMTGYVHSFELDSDFRLVRVNILQPSSQTSIQADYREWHLYEGKKLPGVVKILVKDEKTNKIEIEYNTFDLDKINPPFRIPNNYKERAL